MPALAPKALQAASAVILASMSLAALPQEGASARAADRLLDALEFDRQFVSRSEADLGGLPVVGGMLGALSLGRDKDKVRSTAAEALPMTRARVREVLVARFSSPELARLAEFFETPLGKRYAEFSHDIQPQIFFAALEVAQQVSRQQAAGQAAKSPAREARRAEGFRELSEQAAAGSAEAKRRLAARYCSGDFPDSGGMPDRSKCFDGYKAAAEGGDAIAQYHLGVGYLDGQWTQTREPQAALRWLRTAAAAEHESSALLAGMLMLGLSEERGGIKYAPRFPELVDREAGEQLLRQVASRGNVGARLLLGEVYWHGFGGSAKPAEAIAMYRLAAEQGNRVAMQRLAHIYSEGRVVQRDLEEAIRWYQLASRSN